MKKGFVLYSDQYEPIKNLTNEQKGCLFDAIFTYNCSNPELTFIDPVVEMAFSFFKQAFDRDRAKYLERCEKNAENVRKRWNKKDTNVYDGIRPCTKHTDKGNDKDKDTDNEKDIKKKTKEKIPPPLKEVSEFCLERENGIDAQSFIDHYETSGWMRGKNKIKSWKACIRTWEKNNKPAQQEKQTYATLNR